MKIFSGTGWEMEFKRSYFLVLLHHFPVSLLDGFHSFLATVKSWEAVSEILDKQKIFLRWVMPLVSLNCSPLMDVVSLKYIWEYPFVLEAEEDFLSTDPIIGDTRLGCAMLVAQGSAFLFNRYKLCGKLELSNKMLRMLKDFWSILTVLHLLQCWTDLAFTPCMLELDVTDERQQNLFWALLLIYRLLGIYEDLVFILARSFSL